MDFHQLTARLPTGKESFVDIRRSGAVYVDKTPLVYKIARVRSPQIVTRPRLFGKSTLASTLEELFLHGVATYDCHDSYFKGLAIEPLWQDQGQYLVLRFDFSELTCGCATAAEFERRLQGAFVAFCHVHDLPVPDESLRFALLLRELLEQVPYGSVVLLVDEYDAPALRYLSEEQGSAACHQLMETLFSAIKTYSEKFRCVFFTGTTRYLGLGLSTAANNFKDLTNIKSMAACCGYMRDELKQYFADHLRYVAAVRAGCKPREVSAAQIESLLDELAKWHGGYSFNDSPHNMVFSPWSVLRFFEDEDAALQERWSREADLDLPQFLESLWERLDLTELTELTTGDGYIEVSPEELDRSSLSHPAADPYSVLYHMGYLTISPSMSDSCVKLSCPNEEIRRALKRLVAKANPNLS